jgi:hypothetical protein
MTNASATAAHTHSLTAAHTGVPLSSAALWTSRILNGIAVLFLAFDAAIKVLRLPMAVDGTTQLGYPADVIFSIGVLQVALLAVYLIPRTSVLGAILWTGYLGGAIATHVRVGNPLFTHIVFPVYVAALIWGALWLRDSRVRALLSRHTQNGGR